MRRRAITLLTTFALLVGLGGVTAAQAQDKRPVVAITQMRDDAKTGQGQAMTTMVQTAITDTGKFRVIERDLGDLVTEQGLGNSGMVTTRTPGRTGGFAGVDFIVYGTITSASQARHSDAGANIGRAFGSHMLGFSLGGNCNKVSSSFAVDIKIVDTKTGEVRFAKQFNQQTVSRTSCSDAATLDMTALMRDVANGTATGLSTTMFPIKVLALQSDGTIVLNYGEGALAPGLVLGVYGAGTKVTDQDTGMVTTIDGPLLGTLRVTEVMTKFSKAVPVSAFATPPAVGSIVREMQTPPPADKPGRRR